MNRKAIIPHSEGGISPTQSHHFLVTTQFTTLAPSERNGE